jgi:tRNA threonylcarbamoyladenosine biosynthesis protein TsaE
MKIQSHSPAETEALAARIAKDVQLGDVLFLRGPLGAGKSVLARALIRSLMNMPTLDVPSPTFTLVQTYESANGPLYHYDLYRLKSAEEIYELGWEESLSTGITLVEWPERLGPLAPHRALDIEIKASDNDHQHREILIEDRR